ncbi:MAG: hypothetical protein WBM76_08865 [Woeseiaceae bacterium]
MPILRVFVLIVILAGCGTSGTLSGTVEDTDNPESEGAEAASTAPKYQYVGTYEHFATPIGGSVSVLMSDGKKIKIASIDETNYVNIAVNNGIPEMRISGTYGINGELKKSSTASGEVFIVREIEHLSGGQDASKARKYSALPDFFTVDGDLRGPLTLSELQVSFPDSLARYFNNEDRECFYRQVELRAADMGDPVTMAPIKRVLLASSREQWGAMTYADKRLQLARYVTSMALSAC